MLIQHGDSEALVAARFFKRVKAHHADTLDGRAQHLRNGFDARIELGQTAVMFIDASNVHGHHLLEIARLHATHQLPIGAQHPAHPDLENHEPHQCHQHRGSDPEQQRTIQGSTEL